MYFPPFNSFLYVMFVCVAGAQCEVLYAGALCLFAASLACLPFCLFFRYRPSCFVEFISCCKCEEPNHLVNVSR